MSGSRIVGHVERQTSEWRVEESPPGSGAWQGLCLVGSVWHVAGGGFSSREAASIGMRHMSPPVWDISGGNKCSRCNERMPTVMGRALVGTRHHCRNCGRLVCGKCSRKAWPRVMLPRLFLLRPDTQRMENDKWVRVCSTCQSSVDAFKKALEAGDGGYVQTLVVCGSVNLTQPFATSPDRPYVLHCAARSGNMELFRWLFEEAKVPLFDRHGNALKTREGDTALSIACKRRDVGIFHYLLRHGGAKCAEVVDLRSLQTTVDLMVKGGGGDQGSVEALPYFHENEKAIVVGKPLDNGASSSSRSPPTSDAQPTSEAQDRIGGVQTYADGGNVDDDDENLCVICLTNEIGVVLVPCGHYCLCDACVGNLSNKSCPVCRATFTDAVKAFKP